MCSTRRLSLPSYYTAEIFGDFDQLKQQNSLNRTEW